MSSLISLKGHASLFSFCELRNLKLIRLKSKGFSLLLHSLFDCDGHGDGGADHGVVAHAEEAHHLDGKST